MTTPAEQTSTALRTQLANGSLNGNWTLDPNRSTARLRAKHMWGLAPVNGQFRVLTGDATVSPAGDISGRVALATGSVDTKSTKRDRDLRAANFFMSEKYPQITFTLDKLTLADQDVTIFGALTVRETTRSISFPATVTLAGDGEAAFDAEVEVDRSDYGMTVNHLGMVKMKCSVTLHAVFTRV